MIDAEIREGAEYAGSLDARSVIGLTEDGPAAELPDEVFSSGPKLTGLRYEALGEGENLRIVSRDFERESTFEPRRLVVTSLASAFVSKYLCQSISTSHRTSSSSLRISFALPWI